MHYEHNYYMHSNQTMAVTRLIAVLAVLQCSGTEPAVSPRSACIC